MALTNQATITLAVNVQNMAGLRSLTTGLMNLRTQLMALQRSPAIRSATGVNSPVQAARQQQQLTAIQQKAAIATGKYQTALQRLAQQQGKVNAASKTLGGSTLSLSQRLKQAEESTDALWRASFRLGMLGSQMTSWGKGVFGIFKNIMDVFSEFDFNVRRAAGSLGLFQSDAKFLGDGTQYIQERLDAIGQAAIDVSEEIKLIPADEIAKGFYYWGSMTGFVVNNMDDLNELIKGHTTVLQAAAMTETDFETALKGVYSVITQFYHGDISHTTDVTEQLFYVAQKTAVEFDDLIQSFKMVGPVASALGVDFESVVTVLGELGDMGMRGSMAGRAIRQIFIQLVKPSQQAKQALEGAFSVFMTTTLSDNAKRVLGSIQTDTGTTLDNIARAGSYYDAVFPQGQYAGIENQIGVLAAMTQDMTEKQRSNLLATMSTANSLPVLMALVGKEIRRIQLGITEETKINMKDAHDYFVANWSALSNSWKAVVGSVQRAWDGLKITIGAGIAAWSKPILDNLTKIIDNIRAWVDANPQLVQSFGKLVAMAGALSIMAGSIASIVAALIGLGAATKFISEFISLGGKAATTVGNVATAAGDMDKSFASFARGGLRIFAGALAALIGIMEAVQRNIDYIGERWNALVDIFDNNAGVSDALQSIGQFLGDIQEGINTVFDLLVRRAADAVLVLGQIVDFLTGMLQGLQDLVGGIPILSDLADSAGLFGKAIGLIIGAKMIQGVLGMVRNLGFVNAQLRIGTTFANNYKIAMFDAALAGKGLSGIPGILTKVKAGFTAAGIAAKGFVASTGVGLLVVGLSLLVEWIGQTNKSLGDMQADTDGLAASFGNAADQAESAARRISSSWQSVADKLSYDNKVAAVQSIETMPNLNPPDSAYGGDEAYKKWAQSQVQNYKDGVESAYPIIQAGVDDTNSQFSSQVQKMIRDESKKTGDVFTDPDNMDWVANTDWTQFQKNVEANSQKLLDMWKGAVDVQNAKLRAALGDKAYQINLDTFATDASLVRGMMSPDTIAKLNSMTEDQMNAAVTELILGVASVDPTQSADKIQSDLQPVLQKWADKYGITLGDQFKLLPGLVYDEAGHQAAELKVQQDAWAPIVQTVIDKINPQNVSDWNKVLGSTVVDSTGFATTIGELLGKGLLNDNTVKMITEGAFQATDDLVASIELTSNADNVKNLSEGITAVMTKYVTAGVMGAVPGIQENLQNLDKYITGTDTLDPELMFQKMFETVIPGLDAGTAEQAMLNSDLPDNLKSSYLAAAKILADQGSVGAKALVKAMESGDDNTAEEMAKAFTEFMGNTLDSFVSNVKDGIKKSWKDTIKNLKNLLKPKNSDANQLKILLEQATNKTFIDAMTSTTNTAARETAYDWATNNFILPTIGGIQSAIDNGDYKTANKSMTDFVKDITKFPPGYWEQLDPTVAQGIKSWLESQSGLTVPQSVIDGLTTAINGVGQEAVDNVKPVEIGVSDLVKIGLSSQAIKNIKGMGEDVGAGAASNPISAQVQKWTKDAEALPPATVPAPVVTSPDTTAATNTINTFVTNTNTAIAGINTQIPAVKAPDISAVPPVLRTLGSGINAAFSIIANMSKTWGMHLAGNYAQGIRNGLGWVRQAAIDVANAARGPLHFSRPDFGPLRDLHKWGAELVDIYAKAMRSRSPKVRAAAKNMAQQIIDELAKAEKHANHIGKKVGNHIGDPIKAGGKKARDGVKTSVDALKALSKAVVHIQELLARASAAIAKNPQKAANILKQIQKEMDAVSKGLNKAAKGATDQGRKVGKSAKDTEKIIVTSVKGAHLYNSYKGYLDYLDGVHSRIKKNHDEIKKNRDHARRDLVIDKTGKDNKVTYENNKKVVVEIHLIAESPDGTVHATELKSLRKGIMDALALADIEHIVTVQ